MLQLDEATFSPNSYKLRHWAKKRRPMQQPSRFIGKQLVCCVGAISVDRGPIKFMLRRQRAYTGEDIAYFLRQLKKLQLPGRKLAVFLDNARIHGKKVQAAAKELAIKLLYNRPYRPDLMGIERVWHLAKIHYRKRIAKIRVHQLALDNVAVVKECL